MSSSAAKTSAAIAAGKAKSKAAAAAASSSSSSSSSSSTSVAPSTAKRGSRTAAVAASATESTIEKQANPAAAATKTPATGTKARKEVSSKRKVLTQSSSGGNSASDPGGHNNASWPILRSSDVIGDLNSLAQLRFHSNPATSTAASTQQSPDPSSSYFIATPSPLLHAWATRCATLEQVSEPLRQQSSMIADLQQDMQQFLKMAKQYLQHATSEHSHASSSINLQ